MKLFGLCFFICCVFLFGCNKKDTLDNLDLELETPTFAGKVIKMGDDSSMSVSISAKKMLYNPERPNDDFAYGDVVEVGGKLILVGQTSDSKIHDFYKGHLMIAESTDDGETWTNFGTLAEGFYSAINVSAPSLVKLSDNKILLFFLVKYSSQRIDIYVQESKDGCKSWGTPRLVYGANRGYQILNNGRVQLINKKIVIPISYPISGKIDNYSIRNNELKSFYYYSEDLGQTWKKSKALSADISLLEPNIVSLENPNEWLMNIRTDVGKILFARSLDGGKVWKFEDSNIMSPSSPQTLLYDNKLKAVLMVWNNTKKNYEKHFTNRQPLTLAISQDNGYTWQIIKNIEGNDILYDHSYVALKKIGENFYLVYNQRNNMTGRFRVKICKITFNQQI